MHSRWYLVLLSSLPVQCLPNTSRRGTFENPAAPTRAFFRYWFPDASVDPDLVAADIASAGEIGAGGVEFLPFYNYGGWTASYPKGADWGTYAFGTAPFLNIFRQALEAHADNDMVMDFSIGPNQGQGVPAQSDDEGLQWDLVSLSYDSQYIVPFSDLNKAAAKLKNLLTRIGPVRSSLHGKHYSEGPRMGIRRTRCSRDRYRHRNR